MSSETPATPPPAGSPTGEPPISPLEARVLGCLIEKELTTPDVYPLTLNALVNACNQRNNRAPVLAASPREVELATEQLRLKRFVALFAGADARVPKFKQTIDLVYPLETAARALLGELMLRGAQTTAELRARAERMHPLADAAEVEALLAAMASRPAGPLVRRLARQPGQKEARWVQLLTGEPSAAEVGGASAEPLTVTVALPPEVDRRLAALETEVAQLRAELARLRQALGES
ncbi:MAG TPA: DUF480 domain-containing protein [Opitutaceae bacterium]